MIQKHIKQSRNFALVSENTPLLRDLNVIENIALILEYHDKISIKKAQSCVNDVLKRCGADILSYKKVYELDKKDSIIIKYIRAYMSNFEIILIDRPFSMLDKMEDMQSIFELSEVLDDKAAQIVDLKSNEYYKDKYVLQ